MRAQLQPRNFGRLEELAANPLHSPMAIGAVRLQIAKTASSTLHILGYNETYEYRRYRLYPAYTRRARSVHFAAKWASCFDIGHRLDS